MKLHSKAINYEYSFLQLVEYEKKEEKRKKRKQADDIGRFIQQTKHFIVNKFEFE